MSLYFFLQICHPAAGSFGGKEIPPDEPAVSSLAHGPSNIPPFDPAVATYRRMNWRYVLPPGYSASIAGCSRTVDAQCPIAV